MSSNSSTFRIKSTACITMSPGRNSTSPSMETTPTWSMPASSLWTSRTFLATRRFRRRSSKSRKPSLSSNRFRFRIQCPLKYLIRASTDTTLHRRHRSRPTTGPRRITSQTIRHKPPLHPRLITDIKLHRNRAANTIPSRFTLRHRKRKRLRLFRFHTTSTKTATNTRSRRLHRMQQALMTPIPRTPIATAKLSIPTDKRPHPRMAMENPSNPSTSASIHPRQIHNKHTIPSTSSSLKTLISSSNIIISSTRMACLRRSTFTIMTPITALQPTRNFSMQPMSSETTSRSSSSISTSSTSTCTSDGVPTVHIIIATSNIISFYLWIHKPHSL